MHAHNRLREPHTMCTIFINGFSNQSSNTDPIIDSEVYELTFVVEDDMLSLAY